jgi:indole-3-glycerol phosphate synthase
MLNALSPATNAILPLLLLLHLLSSPLPAASFTSPALLPPRSPRSPALLPLRAVSVLARRAKEAEVAALLASLPSTDPLPALLGTLPSLLSAQPPPAFPSRLRDSLTKRRGNLSIVAEYRLKGTGLAELGGSAAPAIVSKLIRVGGAAAAAVMADPRMGGCDYPDVAAFVSENETARGGVPGPLPVVSSDLVVTEAQVARAKLAGAAAVTLGAAALGKELLKTLLEAAAAFGLEAVVFCGSEEEVVGAVGLGATIVCIAAEEDVEVKKEWRERSIPEGRRAERASERSEAKRAQTKACSSAAEAGSLSERKRRRVLLRQKQARSTSANEGVFFCGRSRLAQRAQTKACSAAGVGSLSECKEGVFFCGGSGQARGLSGGDPTNPPCGRRGRKVLLFRPRYLPAPPPLSRDTT